jgi:hypothetical protein
MASPFSTGFDSGFYTPFELAAETGNYALTGSEVTLKSSKLTADTGPYSLTGTAVTLAGGFVLPAATDSYALTGTAVDLTANLENRLSAGSGSYFLNGQAINLTFEGFSLWVPITDKTSIWTDI